MELWQTWISSEWGPAITAAIALASALSAILSSRSGSPILQAILDVISVISLNIGAAKNADDDR